MTHAQQTKTDIIILDNDATTCFDRQIPPFFSMIYCLFGLPEEANFFFAEILREIEYHIKTSNGILDKFYKHCKLFPIFRSGQGNSVSAPIWLVVSVILMKALRSKHQGMTFSYPDGSLSTSPPIDGIVDDTMLGVNQPGQHASLYESIQEMAQDCADLLWISEGNLELRK